MSAWLEINSATVFRVLESCTIGRAQENDLVLHSPSVSRRHAMVYGTDSQGYWITDVESRNGTFVNEAPVKESMPLKDKDRILMGSYLLTFHKGDQPPTSAVETRPANSAGTKPAQSNPSNAISEVGVLALDPHCRVRRVTPNVKRWLAEYFPRESTTDHQLPPSLESWVLLRQRELQGGASNSVNEEFKVPKGDGVLIARLADAGFQEIVLVFTQQQPRLTVSALTELGLTPREAEVLVWVGQDKTNGEIGVILNISLKTVEVHLYNIYVKLGVENRRQALSTVLDRISPKSNQRGPRK